VYPHPSTGMHRIRLPPGKNVVVYSISAEVRILPRANDTVAIYHGSLLYAVPVGQKVTARRANYEGAPPQALEYSLTPTSTWGVAIDPSTLRFKASPNRDQKLPNPIWAEKASPVSITATVCEIKWELTGGYAPNPPKIGERNCIGDPFDIELVPYGTAKLHMAELPTVDLKEIKGR